MSGILLRYKIGFCENKETKSLAKRGEGPSMTTQSTQGGGNQAQGRKSRNTLADLNYCHREINTLHEFSCARKAVCVHVTCEIVAVHGIYEDLTDGSIAFTCTTSKLMQYHTVFKVFLIMP